MLTLPLRVCPRFDLQGAMISWLDSPDIPFVVSEILDDLIRLDNLRDRLATSTTTASTETNPNTASTTTTTTTMEMQVLKEYHACLLACQQKGFPDDTPIHFQWKGAFLGEEQVYSTLTWEKLSLLWNVAALESQTAASMVDLADKRALSKAVKQWQLAASLLHHISTATTTTIHQLPGIDFSPSMLIFWEKLLLAQGQMTGYYMAGAGGKPKHLLLAKLATAVVPLMTEALDACRELANHMDANHWILYLKGWSLLMEATAEHHESITHKEKGQYGIEMARLEKALTLAQQCQELLERAPPRDIPPHLQDSLTTLLHTLTERYDQAGKDITTHQQPIPPPQDVREIRGELLSKGTQPLPLDLQTLTTPMFSKMLGEKARLACDTFRRDMEALIHTMTLALDQKSDEARQRLAEVNLPHSLTAYKQEQSGGGIPLDLWNRVEAIHQSRRTSQLKTDLWRLRDVAEQARMIHKKICRQLEEDSQMDILFREQHPDFVGHDINEVQRTFRNSLQNYEKLLHKSQEGDSVLLMRLEVLDSDPKYKLLQFRKEQLDRLLPASVGEALIDTSHLSRLLVELSTQFRERDEALQVLTKQVSLCNIRDFLEEIDANSPTAEQEYQQAIVGVKAKFSGIAQEIQYKLDQQEELLEAILVENDCFMDARDAGTGMSSASANTCIVMIEDAIEEIEILTKHLREGNDFYKVVTPKLEQLQQQVGDASVRLTVARYDYEDSHQNNASRRQQEIDDARMAQSLAGDGSNNLMSVRNMPHPQENPSSDIAPDVLPSTSVPGAVNVSHDEPQVRVDDEKVASLVAMDFDMERVVEALKKYDNNVDQALNELLSG